ncbi:hypothetical protein Cpa01nite_17640 [Cellulomonas pakistanensis]|uniref:Uncharacterized protein n=1 Tax=Cellulomonas pakistanensis TaxID=992287 RepID=A0A919U2R9_9CELL|nr:hypothetical protein Cpa01nite_17640 [Cellulomonas pakistanensis]
MPWTGTDRARPSSLLVVRATPDETRPGSGSLGRELARGLLDGLLEIVVVAAVVAVVIGGAGCLGYAIGDVRGAVVGALVGVGVLAVGWVALVVTGTRDVLRRLGRRRR